MDRVLTSEAVPVEVVFSSDGKKVVARCQDNQVRVWDSASGKLLETKPPQKGGRGGTLAGSSKWYADSAPDHSIRVWDLTAGTLVQQLNGHSRPARRMALSSDGKLLASASPEERTVRVWDTSSGKQQHALADGIGGVAQLTFSPDGATVVSANYDNDIRVWRTRSGELVRRIEEMTGAMFAAEFTPDGKYLVTAGLDQTVYVWDTKNWKLARKLTGHDETISALSVSQDGRILVTGGFDVITVRNPVKVVFWDFASGKILRTAKAPHRVVSLAFSPDGQRVAMSAGGKEIQLWDVS